MTRIPNTKSKVNNHCPFYTFKGPTHASIKNSKWTVPMENPLNNQNKNKATKLAIL
jgi:hypothetical protein